METSFTSAQMDVFHDFCGGVPFWNQTQIDQTTPQFSSCFTDTVLIWLPCVYLWLGSPGFILYLYRCRRYARLPLSILNISKGVVTVLLICLSILRLIFQEQDGYMCDQNQSIPPSGYTATGLQFVSFTYSIVLAQIQRHRGLKTSGFPLLFWVLTTGSECVSFYTHVMRQTGCKEDYVYFIYFGVLLVQVGLHCIAEIHKQDGYTDMDRETPCPDENASVLSHLFYSWFTQDVWNCYTKKFSVVKFWELSTRLRSEELGPRLESAWKREVESCTAKSNHRYTSLNGADHNGSVRYTSNGQILTEKSPLVKNDVTGKTSHLDSGQRSDNSPRPSLFASLLRVFVIDWFEAVGFMAVGQMIYLVSPILLRYIIDIIENKLTTQEPAWKGYLYSCLITAILACNSFYFHLAFHHMTTLGLKVKSALVCLIYKKALTMKRSGNQTNTVGEIVNLMSVDCQRIQDSLMFSYYIALLLPILAFAFYQIWDLMGVASMGGLGVVLILFPLLGVVAIRQYLLQRKLLYLKGKRSRILNEIVGGIKVLKMYGWEPSFMKKVTDIRNQELACLKAYAIYSTLTIVAASLGPFVVNFVLVVIYVMTSVTHSLTAEQAFTALSVVNILRAPIALIPFLVNGIVQASVSIKRIQSFLWTEDIDFNNVTRIDIGEYAINIDTCDFAWSLVNPVPTLRSINMKVRDGELVAVVGPVGTGKSSLISAILGEMEKVRGTVTTKGSVAYVPQEAWIQNMTLRDNILFGKPHYTKKYRRVLESCALIPDLQILAGGDMTEIGEKGINISGGQKQRVSLARAVYNNADIYLLDDPLSAVDSHVGKHLFKKVIGKEGLLRHKTRVLVTHGVHWLPMVDRIFVLTDGVISETGSYEELISHNGPFAEFLHNYLTMEEEDEDEDLEVRQIKEKMRDRVETTTTTSDGGLTSDDSIGGKRRGGRRSRTISTQMLSRSVSRTKSNTFKVEDLSRLTIDEASEEGAIKPAVLIMYVKAMGVIASVIAMVSMAVYQGLNIFSNYWLTYWTEDPLIKNTTLSNTQEYQDRTNFYLVMYFVLGVFQCLFLFLSFYLALTRMVTASGKLHGYMLTSILRSPMSFFDTTPIGRIINRFSSDIDIMDNKLPESFRLWTIMVFNTLAIVIVVTIQTPVFVAALVPLGVVYAIFVKFYLPTARQMRRIESICRTPVYNHFSETITGASVIRAYQCGERFIDESRKRIDKNIKFFYASNTGGRWIGIRLEGIGNIIVLCGTIFALVSDDLNGAQVGLSISYVVQITITLNLLVLAISEMEMNIVSAERVKEYTSLPAEAEWEIKDKRPEPSWPRTGEVDFSEYTTRYRAGLDLVLRGINCKVKNGEKIGIVGRTGAGKSSLTLSLFRLIEAAGGCIKIDGVDIADIGLHDLRTKLTILPQDPVLFSGTLRMNLDPFDRYSDDNIWNALVCAHLKDFVQTTSTKLDYECGEGGQNLSVGQRQLVCLARTLLHKTSILILDEATAAVDMETDDLIQDTIRTEFKECTIITIAHRLNTILDYDRVMVLDAGLIKEFDAPGTLLKNTDGVFYGMARDAGLV